MKETKASILFRHWIMKNPQYTCAIEVKNTNEDSLPFSAVSQAQLDYGLAIQSDKGVLMRVQAVTEGMPDYIYLRGEPVVIVVKFPKSVEIISVGTFMLEKSRSKRKSLTSQRAKEISIKSIEI